MSLPYTANLCPNPSFEVSLAGWEPVEGAEIALSDTAYIGTQGLEVTTPGFAIGEGVTSAIAVVPYTTTGSVSLYLYGAPANLTLSAYVSPSSSPIIASVPVTLTGTEWQRVVLNNLPVLEGQELAIIVGTTEVVACTFWVDAAQIEPESPAQDYIDGDQPFCNWTGVEGLSTSYQQYQFPTGSVGGMFLDGTATPVDYGETFNTGSVGTMLLSGSAISVVANPVAAFNDFALFTTTDLDPAQTYPSWTTAGNSNGTGTTYTRPYSLFMAPLDYQVSSGYLWNRAAYMALGVYFSSVAAGATEEITDVQVELMPYVVGGTPTPTAYSNPRTIETIIKPTRLNYVPNPSIDVTDANWNPVCASPATTLAQSTTQFVPAANLTLGTVSTASLAVTIPSGLASNLVNNGTNLTPTFQGCTITIPDLIFGDVYTVSAWVLGGTGFFDITMQIAGLSASSISQGSGYGEGTFGGGYYGGESLVPGNDMTVGQWYQPSLTFTATASTMQLNFVALIDTSTIAYPATFYVDAAMLESGDILGLYFDGSTDGPNNFVTDPDDYFWGLTNVYTGTTSGRVQGVNTQSYYYERSIVTGANVDNATGGVIQQVLNQHTPLGITAAAPQYLVPYTQ